MNESLICLQGLVKIYRSVAGEVMALRGIDLGVETGALLVVTGKSGSGKTTLVNMIAGLDQATSGEVWVAGCPLHRLSPDRAARWRRDAVGVVFQSFALLPSLTVLHNVMLPMDFAGKLGLRKRRRRALALLEQVGIADHAYKLPSEVSGGQQQRVAIARALANDPQLIVADEPTGSLDSGTANEVMTLFESLRGRGKTIVLVTHDPDLAQRGTREVRLVDGQLLEGTSPAVPSSSLVGSTAAAPVLVTAGRV